MDHSADASEIASHDTERVRGGALTREAVVGNLYR